MAHLGMDSDHTLNEYDRCTKCDIKEPWPGVSCPPRPDDEPRCPHCNVCEEKYQAQLREAQRERWQVTGIALREIGKRERARDAAIERGVRVWRRFEGYYPVVALLVRNEMLQEWAEAAERDAEAKGALAIDVVDFARMAVLLDMSLPYNQGYVLALEELFDVLQKHKDALPEEAMRLTEHQAKLAEKEAPDPRDPRDRNP